MTLSARAIALQGIGFGPALTGVQGLAGIHVSGAALRAGLGSYRIGDDDEDQSLRIGRSNNFIWQATLAFISTGALL
jgi:hypothetical protein